MKNLQLSDSGYVILLIALAGLLMSWLWKPSRKKRITSRPDMVEAIQSRLIALGLSPSTARMWVAVSRFETGDFTSNLFLQDNNFWGMKAVQRRETTQDYKTTSGFGGYRTTDRGIFDIFLYMREFNYPTHFDSVNQMVAFMKSKGYFEEPLGFYLNGVKSFL